jgi:hypothetical protein
MTPKKETGGSAFPFSPSGTNCREESGLSIRDYFAGMALQGVMHAMTEIALSGKDVSNGRQQEYIVETSYQIADAMILERSK